ncbi:MAG: hypothetical protein AAGF12_36815 [Myxococcota bacterium]
MRNVVILGTAVGLWLGLARFFFPPLGDSDTDALERTQLRVFSGDAADRAELRETNPEWDFMGRTFGVLALANRALDAEDTSAHLAAMDSAIDDTLALEAEYGPTHFLMSYWRRAPFRAGDGRVESVFVDGEIALMLAARQLIEEKPAYEVLLRERVERIRASMEAGPARSAESYPNECWTFCNTTALLALVMADETLGTDHRPFAIQWIRYAKEHLTDPETGLLISSYTYEGEALDGPEGSSIWMSAHNLAAIDPEFAADQYHRARTHLGKEFLGFGWAAEWPESWPNHADVDSGPVIPILDASAGSSGLALLGAATFGDDGYELALQRSLRIGAFPQQQDGELRFTAAGSVGDAVVFYAQTVGPVHGLLGRRAR